MSVASASSTARSETEYFVFGGPEQDHDHVPDFDVLARGAIDHFLFGYWPSLPDMESRWTRWFGEPAVRSAIAHTDAVISSISSLSGPDNAELDGLADRALSALAAQDIDPTEWSRRIAEDVADTDD